MRAVALTCRGGEIILERAGVASVPDKALTAGELTDGLAIAARLRGIWNDCRLGRRNVAAAIGGDRVICQSDRLQASQLPADLAQEKAAELLRVPREGVAWDFQSAGPEQRGSIVWAAAPSERVAWLRETVSLSGKRLAAVAPRACAVANAFAFNYKPEPDLWTLLIDLRARSATIALLQGELLVYAREARLTRTPLLEDEQYEERLLDALESHWDALRARAGTRKIEKILVSGQVAERSGLLAVLAASTARSVEALDPFSQMLIVDPATRDTVGKSRCAFAVAAGMALSAAEPR